MMFQEISLGKEQGIELNGSFLSFSKEIIRDKLGRRLDTLRVTKNRQPSIVLLDSIDDNQCVDSPRIFCVFSKLKEDKIIIFGGKKVYWLDLDAMKILRELLRHHN